VIFENSDEPYVIAEVGSNHNGDMKLAEELIKAAKVAGADCVKFQSWTKGSIFSKIKYQENYFLKDDYRNRNDFTLEEIVEKFSVSEQQLIELKSIADDMSIDFACTPFSNNEATFIAEKLDVPFIKIASMDVNNYPFLDFVAKLGKPVIISTGLGTLSEIDRAVSVFENAGNKSIAILHCVAEYPPLDTQMNLRNIVTLMDCYPDHTVGFSDHSIGACLPLAAIALGAKIIEKHFTLDKNMSGWDHKLSATPAELKDICHGGQRVNRALGSSRIMALETDERKREFRRSIVTTRPILKGEMFGSEDLTFKRPGTGVAPEFVDFVIGRVAKRDLEKDELLKSDDF
jgi:sialic acid synthase SpsE